MVFSSTAMSQIPKSMPVPEKVVNERVPSGLSNWGTDNKDLWCNGARGWEVVHGQFEVLKGKNKQNNFVHVCFIFEMYTLLWFL